MKTFFNTVHYFLIAGIIAIGLLLLGTLMPIPGNFKVKIVKSGSMEPTIRTGGIVVIRPEPSYGVGEVITFGADTKTQIPTTHRIVGISGVGASQVFVTKGDANDAPDPTQTHSSDIRGKVVLTVPYLGFVLDFARKPIGFVLLVGVPACAIILDEIGKIIREIQKLRKKKRKQNDDSDYGSGNMIQSETYFSRHQNVDGIIRKSTLRPTYTRHAVVSSTSIKPTYSKMVIALVLIGMGFTSLSALGSTSSYFADTEYSTDNFLKAGTISLQVGPPSNAVGLRTFAAVAPVAEVNIPAVDVGSSIFELSVEQGEGSLPLQYTISTELSGDNPVGCDEITLDAWIHGYHYVGLAREFELRATTTIGSQQFMVGVPTNSSTLASGAICKGELVYKAHIEGIAQESEKTFTDEKRYPFSVQNYTYASAGESSATNDQVPEQISPAPLSPIENSTLESESSSSTQGENNASQNVESVEPHESSNEDSSVVKTLETPAPVEQGDSQTESN